MTSLLAVLALGFVLGLRHAADPDHVIAVSTLVARHRTMRGAAWLGALWGVGHTFTILVVGGGIVAFGWAVPPGLGLSFELGVGLMLIALGLASLRVAPLRLRDAAATAADDGGPVHTHAHSHGDYVHTHPHGHDPERHPHRADQTPLAWLDRRLGGFRAFELARPVVVGVVHGLAGSAGVALLVLPAVRNARWALVYLLLFGAGTLAGMMLLTAALAAPFTRGRPPSPRVATGLRLASGVAAVAFGAFLTYRIGVVGGLFRG